jgi:hypothetical protein
MYKYLHLYRVSNKKKLKPSYKRSISKAEGTWSHGLPARQDVRGLVSLSTYGVRNLLTRSTPVEQWSSCQLWSSSRFSKTPTNVLC